MIEPAPEHPTPPTATAAFDNLFKTGFTRVVRTLVLMLIPLWYRSAVYATDEWGRRHAGLAKCGPQASHWLTP